MAGLDSERWRSLIGELLTDTTAVAHHTLQEGENEYSIIDAISEAGQLEGVANRLKISSGTGGSPQKTIISFWIEAGTDLPEETPEQEAVDTSPASREDS